MLAKNRENRYRNPDDLILDLKCLLAGDPPMIAGQKADSLATLSEGDTEDDNRGPTEAQLTELASECLGPGADDYLELLTRFDAAHPRDEPHYYLSLLGTHPDHRGKGIGMALLEHDLVLIDAEGLPAYLESSNPANNDRYGGVGFQAVGEFAYPGGGPVVTTMWRPAR